MATRTSKTKSTKAPKSTKNKKRRRVKKRRYHTGIHVSPKCDEPIKYRSGWELVICKYLDESPDVVCYMYEKIIVPYTTSPRSKKLRKYIPDFVIIYKNGDTKMVEVKRENMLTCEKVQRKAEAAKIWCAQQTPPILYEFWTDSMVLPLQKAQKIRDRYAKLEKEGKI